MIRVPGILDTECAQLYKLWSRPPPHVSQSTPSKDKKRHRGGDEEDIDNSGKGEIGREVYGRERRSGKRPKVKRQVTPIASDGVPRKWPEKLEFAYGLEGTSQHAINRALVSLRKHPDSKRMGK